MASMSTYTSEQEMRNDIVEFGLNFQVIHEPLPQTQLNKCAAVYWYPYKDLPKHVQTKVGFGVTGVLFFGTKAYPFVPNVLTKLGLKGFLFRSTKCGICTQPALVGSNGCNRCGFLICAVCEMKLALKEFTNIPTVSISCAKCRHKYIYGICPNLDLVACELQHRFNNEEKLKIRKITATFGQFMVKYGKSEKQVRKMHRDNEELKDKLDMSKCASCKKSFTNKRSTCSACSKVSYCDKECQIKHWKQHKQDCKLFQTYNDQQ
eukprot:179357_1